MLLFRADTAHRHPRLVAAAGSLMETAMLDPADPVASARTLGLRGCTTFLDSELDTCDLLLAGLGLPGAASAERPWDKLVQRKAFGSVAGAVDAPGDLRAAVATLGLPGLLKPRRGVAGAGIGLLREQDDVDAEYASREQWARLTYERFIPNGSHPSGVPWLADYVSVDTVSVADARHHVAVVDKLPLHICQGITETGDVYPSRLQAADRARVLAATDRALAALGVRDRLTHTELRVTPQDVEVIEVNGRLGGEVHRLVRQLGGPDLAACALTVALGRAPEVAAGPGEGYRCTLYVPFPVRTGLVRSDVRTAELVGIPGVVSVDEIARQGDPRAAIEGLTCRLLLAADSAEGLDKIVSGAVSAVAALFAADDVSNGHWVTTMLSAIERGGSA
ncbi:hypothetical protein [Streptomyces sp. NBC_00523]|uniref:ATP-grasp domain-containing protein n=1 Tax=unclassified Streptomyces TaxID=2593676 RepID=UPI002E813100|nr:hypothetical protein [Streptomyces sp. NBC_00523]WUD01292.1 hypothetical protein OHS17_17305 [Streptomyces sp. NBC_00523]